MYFSRAHSENKNFCCAKMDKKCCEHLPHSPFNLCWRKYRMKLTIQRHVSEKIEVVANDCQSRSVTTAHFVETCDPINVPKDMVDFWHHGGTFPWLRSGTCAFSDGLILNTLLGQQNTQQQHAPWLSCVHICCEPRSVFSAGLYIQKSCFTRGSPQSGFGACRMYKFTPLSYSCVLYKYTVCMHNV